MGDRAPYRGSAGSLRTGRVPNRACDRSVSHDARFSLFMLPVGDSAVGLGPRALANGQHRRASDGSGNWSPGVRRELERCPQHASGVGCVDRSAMRLLDFRQR